MKKSQHLKLSESQAPLLEPSDRLSHSCLVCPVFWCRTFNVEVFYFLPCVIFLCLTFVPSIPLLVSSRGYPCLFPKLLIGSFPLLSHCPLCIYSPFPLFFCQLLDVTISKADTKTKIWMEIMENDREVGMEWRKGDWGRKGVGKVSLLYRYSCLCPDPVHTPVQ